MGGGSGREARPGFQNGDPVCAAIRGEQILMRKAPGENTLEATIESVVFTGEVCRIRSRLGGDELSIACINMDGEALKAGDGSIWRYCLRKYTTSSGKAEEMR